MAFAAAIYYYEELPYNKLESFILRKDVEEKSERDRAIRSSDKDCSPEYIDLYTASYTKSTIIQLKLSSASVTLVANIRHVVIGMSIKLPDRFQIWYQTNGLKINDDQVIYILNNLFGILYITWEVQGVFDIWQLYNIWTLYVPKPIDCCSYREMFSTLRQTILHPNMWL